MTRFEGNDLQTQPAVLDATAASGGKLHEDYLSAMKVDFKNGDNASTNLGDAKFIKVADGPQLAQAQDAGQESGDGKLGVKELAAADPKELPPNLRALQGLAQHFDKADDKAKAMTEVKPEVEKIVKAADDNFVAAQAKAEKDSVTLKPKFEAAEAKLKESAAKIQASLKGIPEEDGKHIASEVGLLMDPKSSPALKKAIEADLSSHKGLVPAVKEFTAARTAAVPVMKEVQAMQEGMKEAEAEPLLTRMIYADMLEQSGDKAGAKQVQAEGMALQMGMTIEQFRQLQKQKQDQDNKAPSDKTP
jgi:hypothetical protein